MERLHFMNLYELLDAIPTLSKYQSDQVCEMVSSYLKLNEELKDTTPTVCPCCKCDTTRFIKRGFSGKKQRYQCKNCGSRFTYDAMQITSHSHISPDKWNAALKDTLELKTIDETADDIGVSHTTAFFMRHKILRFMEIIVENTNVLDDLVEADETYVLESEKGVKQTKREPRLHKSTATKPGLSHDYYCLCVATDRKHHIVAKCVNRAKPSGDDIEAAIGKYINTETVFQCDGSTAYNQLIEAKRCKKITLVGHEEYDKVHHLNTVNAIHSRFKEMLKIYRNVSSKYLNRYAALFCLIVSNCEYKTTELSDQLRCQIGRIRSKSTLSAVFETGSLLILS